MLIAARKASEIAEKKQPGKQFPKKGGQLPGPKAYLVDQGFSPSQAQEIRSVGNLPEKTFQNLIARPNPPATASVRSVLTGNLPQVFIGKSASVLRNHDPKDAAHDLSRADLKSVVRNARFVCDWMDEFLRIAEYRLKVESQERR